MKKILLLTIVILKGITRKNSRKGLSSDPKIILFINLVIFLLIFSSVYLALSILKEETLITARSALNELIINIPFFIFIMFILVGILLIFETGESIFDVETINWIPIKPYEYVVSSIISTMYIYSFPLFILTALIIPFLIKFQAFFLILIFILALLSSKFMALLFVEIIKIFLEASFSKIKRIKGKYLINFRLFLIIIISSIFIVITNPSLIQRFLFNTKNIIDITWFLPFNWPSTSLKFYIEENYIGALINILLTIIFCFSLLVLASFLRNKYWVLEKPSIIIEKRKKKDFLNKIMKESKISALIIKDLKAYVRKMELIRTYSPILGLVILSFFISSSYQISLIIPTIINLIISTAAIGYEGRSIINIYYLPISYNEYYKSKFIFIIFISFILSLITILNIYFILYLNLLYLFILFCFIFLISLLTSKIGLTIGLKYPKFEETKLSKMISLKGAYLSLIIGGIIYIFTIFLIRLILNLQINLILFLLLIFTLIFYLLYIVLNKINLNLSKKLLEDVSKI